MKGIKTMNVQTVQNTRQNHIWKGVASCAMGVILSTMLVTPAFAESTAIYEKDENVYGTLAGDGETEALYIVNEFDVTNGGTIEDHGDYDTVANLTDMSDIKSSDGLQTISVDKGMFYYQGNIENGDLPWDFGITYTLDGQEVEADSLAGESGHLVIHITSSPNDAVDAMFFRTYMLQVSFSVPAEDCSNISAGSGTIADAGENRQITYTVMPGESGDLTFEADVDDFEMSAISIAGASMASSIAASTGMAIEPESFTSSENGNTEHVQFALTTQAIEIPDEVVPVEHEPEKNFFERVLALFGM